ncbi:MAG: YitT family protein [Faecalibacillus sp.]
MIKRCIIYVFGILVLGFGIVLNTKTGLGVAAINSVPYGLSQMTNLTLGNWTTILYIGFIILQIIIYKKCDIKVLLQFPFSYLMGMILDFYDQLLNFVPQNMIISLILLLVAIILTALGAYLVVAMNFVPNPADGMVNALSYLLHKEFGQMKWMFDCLMMSMTIIMTFIISGHVIGIGIGTILSALCIGRVIQLYTKLFGQKLDDIVLLSQTKSNNEQSIMDI